MLGLYDLSLAHEAVMAQQFDCFCRAEQGQEGVGQTGMCRLCQQGCIDLCFRMEVLKRN